MASLPVYFEQRLVGTIHVDRGGPSFTYASGWIALRGAFPISLTMPLKSERFASETFLPWAENLLPESEQLRTLGQLLGMARSDVIGLLSAIGRDTAGALSFGQPGRAYPVQWRNPYPHSNTQGLNTTPRNFGSVGWGINWVWWVLYERIVSEGIEITKNTLSRLRGA